MYHPAAPGTAHSRRPSGGARWLGVAHGRNRTAQPNRIGWSARATAAAHHKQRSKTPVLEFIDLRLHDGLSTPLTASLCSSWTSSKTACMPPMCGVGSTVMVDWWLGTLRSKSIAACVKSACASWGVPCCGGSCKAQRGERALGLPSLVNAVRNFKATSSEGVRR